MEKRYFEFMLRDSVDAKIKFCFDIKKSSLYLTKKGFEIHPKKRTFSDVKVYSYNWKILVAVNPFDFSDDEKMERIDHWKPYKEILRFDNVNCSSLLILSDFIYKAIKKKKDCKDIYYGESYWHILYGGGLLYKDYLKFKKENPKLKSYKNYTKKEYYKKKNSPYIPGHLEFIVYDKDSWISQRFVLSEEKSEEFAKFIDSINQYMLEHGELWTEEK